MFTEEQKKKKTITATVRIDQFVTGTVGRCENNVNHLQLPVTREVVRQGMINCAASPVKEGFLYTVQHCGIEWPVTKEEGCYRLALPCPKTINVYRQKIQEEKEEAEREFKVRVSYLTDPDYITLRVSGITKMVLDKLRADEVSISNDGEYEGRFQKNDGPTHALISRLQEEAFEPGQLMVYEVYHLISLLEVYNLDAD